MPIPYDATIIGSGLNGLTAAAYLARAGRRVVVLERRATIGGGAAPAEIAPGVRCDVCMEDPGWIPDRLVRDLDLRQHGLELIESGVDVVAPLPAGGALMLSRDLAASADAIRPLSPADAAAWPPFCEWAARMAAFLASVYAAPPPRPFDGGPRDLLALATLGTRLRRLGRRDMVELLRTLPMSVAELLDDRFQSDALKAVVGGVGVHGLFQGPRAAGTAFVLLHRLVGSAPGTFRVRSRVRGGVAALAGSLAAAARARGVEFRTGVAVDRIDVQGGAARAVILAGGDELAAGAVLSTADARHTFLDLVGAAALDPEFVQAVRRVRYRGSTAYVHVAVGELPRLAGVDGRPDALGGVIALAPSLDVIERAYDDAKYGAASRRPILEVTIPTLRDASLAPAGTHVLSARVRYAPYRLRDGAWTAAQRDTLGDAVLDGIAQYAPNVRDAVIGRHVVTPVDLEDRFGFPEGDASDGELALDQALFMRPVPGWAWYRTPVRGLFLGGSAAHPGPGIVGGAGALAARAMLADG